MKNFIIILFLIFISNAFAQNSTVFDSGTAVRLLKDQLLFNTTDTRIMASDSDSPNSVAKSAALGSLYIESDTGLHYWKADGGSSTNWVVLPYGDTSGNLLLNPSGVINASKSFNLLAENELRFQDAAGGEYMGFKAPTTLTTSTTFTLPDGDGSDRQILQTDGNGVLSWNSANASPVSGTVSFVPSVTGLGAVTNASGFYNRVGDRMIGQAWVTTEIPTGVAAYMSVPDGLTIDFNKCVSDASDSRGEMGDYSRVDSGENFDNPTSYHEGRLHSDCNTSADNDKIFMAALASSDTSFQQTAGNSIANGGESITFTFNIPISSWASSTDIITQQAFPAASIKWINVTNCANTVTSSAYTTFNDTDCTYAAAQKIGGAITPTVTGDIALKVASVPRGKYRVSIAGYMFAGGSTGCSFTLFDGVNQVGPVEIFDTYIDGWSGIVEYTSDQTNLEWLLQADRTSGASTCNFGASTTNTSIEISLSPISGVMVGAINPFYGVKYDTDSGQSIDNNLEEIIDFDSTTTGFDNATGAVTTGATWRFTVPTGQAGIYSVSTKVNLGDDTGTWNAGEYAEMNLYKNNVRHAQLDLYDMNVTATVNFGMSLQGSTMVDLAAGDFIDVRVYHNQGAAIPLVASEENNWIIIKREY
jgi:hypothetical protein